MTGLFLKDLLNLKQQAKVFIIAAILYLAVCFLQQESSLFSVFMVVLTTMIPITAFAYDDKAKWNRYALTMPVSCRDIVLSKYLLAFAVAVFALLLSLTVDLIMTRDLHESLTSSLGFFLISLVLSAVFMPFFFRFGVEKARMIMLVLVLIPTLLSLLVSKLNITMPDPADLRTILTLAPFAGILLIALSILLSIRIYSKKEF